MQLIWGEESGHDTPPGSHGAASGIPAPLLTALLGLLQDLLWGGCPQRPPSPPAMVRGGTWRCQPILPLCPSLDHTGSIRAHYWIPTGPVPGEGPVCVSPHSELPVSG